MAIRHFLTLLDLSPVELQRLIARAIELKQQKNKLNNSMQNRVLGMIFEKSSTRTRVSFEAGMAQMGGHAIFLSPRDTQLGRGEPVDDSARVLSRMVDIIMVRTFGQDIVERFAAHSRVPVINALTNSFHPCQLLADMMTFIELRGSLQGRKVAWIGDGYNMCHTYIHAAKQFGFHLHIACPAEYAPDKQLVAQFQDCVTISMSPQEAVTEASLVATDVWASMGHEAQKEQRLLAFQPYQVTPALMDHALPDALFMHCLPAHRGEEVSHAMMEDPRADSVWTEAENRLHVQKALIEFLLNPLSYV